MIFNSILFLMVCGIILAIIARKKQKIIDKYGKPIDFLTVSSLNFQFRPSGINLTFILIYDNKILISIGNEEISINKDNFISFDEPTFLKPCAIKFKVDTIYKTRSIYFSIIRKNQIEKIKRELKNF